MNFKFSFLCPSYNHSKYVAFFIETILSQTYNNWELIIVDDCSSDNNIAEIEKYSDSRIQLIKHEYNKGINAALNTAFDKSTGDFCIIIASDDMLQFDFLETMRFIINENGAKLIYSDLFVIDENNSMKKKQPLWTKSVDIERLTLIKDLFLNYNRIHSPGMCIERNIFNQLFPLNVSFCQHQDYYLHIKLLALTDYYINRVSPVLYRVPSKKTNISAYSPVQYKRERVELIKLMDTFFELPVDLVYKICGKNAETNPDFQNFYLGNLALTSKVPEKRIWGYLTLLEFLRTQENWDSIYKAEKFSYSKLLFCSKSLLGKEDSIFYKVFEVIKYIYRRMK